MRALVKFVDHVRYELGCEARSRNTTEEARAGCIAVSAALNRVARDIEKYGSLKAASKTYIEQIEVVRLVVDKDDTKA